nr:MAG TPA: hypothetical protein [Caudoviricetes sp.]
MCRSAVGRPWRIYYTAHIVGPETLNLSQRSVWRLKTHSNKNLT